MDRKRLLVMLPLLSIFLCLLGGLYFTVDQQITDEGVRLDRLEQATQFETLNTRLIPEFNQMIETIQSDQQFALDKRYYQTSEKFYLDYPTYRMTIDNMAAYSLKASANQPQGGALVLLAITLTNRTEQAIRVPVDQLVLYTASKPNFLNRDNFKALENGDLLQIMKRSNNRIPAKASVEGYLLFELDTTAWLKARQVGVLSLVNPLSEQAQSSLIAKYQEKLSAGLYLPLSRQVAKGLMQCRTQLFDLFNHYQLGEKQILADQWPNVKLSDQALTCQINRIELADVAIQSDFADLLQVTRGNWASLSISYQLTNASDYTLSVADNQLSVIDSHGNIYDNSIRMRYPEALLPGQSRQVTETLLLSRHAIRDYWQGQSLQVHFNAMGYHSRLNDAEITEQRLQLVGPKGISQATDTRRIFHVSFEWQPSQTAYYLHDLTLADEETWQAEQIDLQDRKGRQSEILQ